MSRPAVGRVVHYSAPFTHVDLVNRLCNNGKCVMANIVGVDVLTGGVVLDVRWPIDTPHVQNLIYDVPESPNGEGRGTWHWPERVE